MFKGSEDVAAKSIDNWSLPTTPLSVDASFHEICSEYPYNSYIARN